MRKLDQLVATALSLFYRQGYHATGVDQISRESAVTKKTLYTYFASKEELVLAALKLRHRQFIERLQAALQAAPPADCGPAYLRFLAAWIAEPDYCGCAFINAAAEYPAQRDPIHQLADAHKGEVRQLLAAQLAAAACPVAAMAAAELFLLGEGMIVAGQVSGPDPARLATAEALLESRRAVWWL